MTDTAKLDAEIAAAEARFNSLGAEINARKEQVATLNREISERLEEQVRIQGEFRILQKLRKDGEDEGVKAS